MPESDHPSNRLDPAEVASQVAALADHLRRSGVQWLPKPREEQVAMLRATMLAGAGNETGGEQAATSVASKSAEENRNAESVAAASPPSSPDRSTAATPTPNVSQGRLAPVDAVTSFAGPYPGASLPLAEREAELSKVNELVSDCHRCQELAKCRNKTVFGEGSATPRVAFFGEGPGADEDRSGRPFVGRAGQLLTKMIEACKFDRSDVYILNTVKCRPPGNRNPAPDEIENCRDYYRQQLAILRPEYIVCLGAVSAQELLQSKLSVGRLRGKLHKYHESKILVTYHPAYLLRNPAAKKAAWDDLQLMLRDAKIIH